MFLMPALARAWWIFLTWLVCGLVILVFDRLSTADGSGIWGADDPVVSVLAYLVLFLTGPFLVVGFLVWFAWEWLSRLWRKPFVVATVTEERPESEDSVLVDLVRRRAALDPRLAGVEVDRWPMCQFWPTPEAMILDVVTKYHQLRRAGASEDVIWQKLEDYRADLGITELPTVCTLPAFIQHRLAIEDQDYLGLVEFLEAQITRCEQLAMSILEHKAKCSGWPPAEWLTERVTLDSITTARPLGAVPESRAQAILQLRAYKSRQEIKTLQALMLPGDELWAFSSPPPTWQRLMGRSGLALVRKGRSIAHVITGMN